MHDPTVLGLAGKSPTPPISSSPISKPEPVPVTEEEPSSHSSLDEESWASVEEIGPEKVETESQEEPVLEEEESEPAESLSKEEEQEEISNKPEESVQLIAESTPDPIIPQPALETPQEEPESPLLDPVLPIVEEVSPAVSSAHPSSSTVVLFPSKVAKPTPVEAKAETPKIITLPTKSANLTKIQTTQMARQSRSMAEIKIKTLDQIKKEKEDQRQRPADSPASTPSKVTMMPRVTRTQGAKAKPLEIPQEPTPVKRAKLVEESMLVGEDMKQQEPAVLDSLQQDAHMELLYEEIDDIINAEAKPQEPISVPLSLPVVREEEEATVPVIEMQESVPEAPSAVFSPGALLATNELEVGEVIEPPPPEFTQIVEPLPTETVPESLPPPPPPLQEPPQVREKPKPQPSASRKTVIALPSAPKPKGTGEILTLEQIIERKKQKAAEESAKAEANKPIFTAQPSPVQLTSQSTPTPQSVPTPPQFMSTPSQPLKRPRDPETPSKEASEPLKKPKPQTRPPPTISPQILGDWEPLSTAFKSLDFSLSPASEEDVAGMRTLALRMSTPNGFLEVLEELEERVTELEVAQGLPPAVDSEFVVLSLEDQINWLYEHTSSL